MTTVSVILPTYNEKDNITPLVEAVLRSSQHPTSVWVVDDDSPDGTWQRVAEMASHDPRVHLIHRTDAKGLTSAIARGIRDSDGDIARDVRRLGGGVRNTYTLFPNDNR